MMEAVATGAPTGCEEGPGRVVPVAFLDLAITPDAAMEGLASRCIEDACGVVHGWNRNAGARGFPGQRLALAFPFSRPGDPSGAGHVVRVCGAPALLEDLVRSGVLDKTARLGMTVGPLRQAMPGAGCAAFLRDRTQDENSKAGRARAARRRARRAGADSVEIARARPVDPVRAARLFSIPYAGRRLAVAVTAQDKTLGQDAPPEAGLVSTFGLSGVAAPVWLPIHP